MPDDNDGTTAGYMKNVPTWVYIAAALTAGGVGGGGVQIGLRGNDVVRPAHVKQEVASLRKETKAWADALRKSLDERTEDRFYKHEGSALRDRTDAMETRINNLESLLRFHVYGELDESLPHVPRPQDFSPKPER